MIRSIFSFFGLIFKEFCIIVKQSLTNPDKEYSSKKLICVTCLFMCIFQALTDQFTSYKINIEVFKSFLLMVAVASGFNLVGQLNYYKNTTDKEIKDNFP